MKKLSFRAILTAAIILMAVIPVLLVSLYYYNTEKAILVQSRKETLDASLSVASTLYDISCKQFMDTKSIVAMITRTSDRIPFNRISRLFDSSNQSEKAEVFSAWKNSVEREFIQFKQKSSLLDGEYSIYLYFPETQTLFDSHSTYYEDVTRGAFQQFYPASLVSEDGSWCIINRLSYYKKSSEKIITRTEQNLSFIYLLSDSERHQTKAIAIVNFDPSIFHKISCKQNNIADGSIMLFLQDGTLLYNDATDFDNNAEVVWDAIEKNAQNTSALFPLTKKQYVLGSTSLGSEFVLVEILPLDSTLQSLSVRSKRIVLVTFAVSMLFAAIAAQLARRFYSPLRILSDHMNTVKSGDLSCKINHARVDEYGRVFDCFNSMLDQINNLIESNTTEKLLRVEAELFLLQERINPHFIYNSLEIIYSLAKLNRTDEIPRVTKALSDFFRMCLSDGSSDVPLRTAMDICEKYLIIQNTRFNGKINYETHVDEELYRCIVPKFCIQILVENAVVHGIEPLLHPGNISVDVNKIGNMLCISVTDDGIGISLGKVEEINHKIRLQCVSGPNFALRNLNRQITMLYGERYGVTLSQPEVGGTCVKVTFPYLEGN